MCPSQVLEGIREYKRKQKLKEIGRIQMKAEQYFAGINST